MRQLTYAHRERIRDIYLPLEQQDNAAYSVSETRLDEAAIYLGQPVPYRFGQGPVDSDLARWFIELISKSSEAQQTLSDFRIQHENTYWRAKRQYTANGWMLCLRALPSTAPSLDDLALPPGWRELMLDPDLLYGGLVLFTAPNGQGKTTTASAMVRSRLEKFSGKATTVEDPPEVPLNGWHRNGHCSQIPVVSSLHKKERGYAEALHDSLRFFPTISGGGTILFVGEIRDPESAAQTLLAASNGHLVIATMHGATIPKALARMVHLSSSYNSMEWAREQLADVCKGCFLQKLRISEDEEKKGWKAGQVQGHVLWANEYVERAIRENNLEMLRGIVERQTAAASSVTSGSIKESLRAIAA